MIFFSLLNEGTMPSILFHSDRSFFVFCFSFLFCSRRAVQLAFELGRERNPSAIAHERRSKLSKTRDEVSGKMAEYSHWASEADKHIDHKACFELTPFFCWKKWRGGCVCAHVMHGRSRMTIDPRIPTMQERSITSGFHRPGRHCLHRARRAVRCAAIRVKGALHPAMNRS